MAKKYKVRFTQDILCYKAGDEKELEKKEYDMLLSANVITPICDFTVETHTVEPQENTMKEYKQIKRRGK